MWTVPKNAEGGMSTALCSPSPADDGTSCGELEIRPFLVDQEENEAEDVVGICAEIRHPMVVASGIRRIVFQVGGVSCIGLAIAGVFLPVLPTTPFLILASFLFYRSSPELYLRLHQHRFSGPLLQKWERDRGVSFRVKLGAVGVVLLMVALTLLSGRISSPMQWLIMGLAGIGIMVILFLPSPRRQPVSLVQSEEFASKKVG